MPRDYDERFEVQNDRIKAQLLDIGERIGSQLPEGWGFGLFLFSFGEGGSMFWISNAERADAVNTLKEWIAKQEDAAVALPQGSLVLSEVVAERVRQDAKWGGPAHDDTHTLIDWWHFIRRRMVGRAYPGGTAEERRDMVQIAALAIAAVESMDRKAARAKES